MNKLSNYFTLVFLLLSTIVTSQNNNESIYNYNDAFGHGFYTKTVLKQDQLAENQGMRIGKIVLIIL